MRVTKQKLALLLSIAAFLILGFFLVKPELPQWPPYAASSADRSGVKGLYTLLKEQGHPVKEWRKEWRFLPDSDGQTLVVFQPQEIAEQDREVVQDWLNKGNHLLLFDNDPAYGDWFAVEEHERVTETVEVTDTARPEQQGLSAEVSSPYRLRQENGLEPLIEDEQGIIAGKVTVGGGSVSLFVVPEWARNDMILEHSHFELLWPYLQVGSGAVWFDEYYHGLRDKPGVLAVYPGWLLAVLLQLTIGALLWLWFKAVRFGPAYTPREWTVRRGDETLLAAAGWYERRKLAYDALEHQVNYVRSLMRERWGVRTDARDGQVLAAARRHWGKDDVNRLADLLKSWQTAQQAPYYTPKQLTEDSRKADEVILKLEKE